MINTNAFDYINVLAKAADASALRHEVISNNISNNDTPGYKRKDVAFESELKRALKYRLNNTNVDARVADVNTAQLKGRVYTDIKNFSYRLDGNNVDMETENVMLAENQIKYQGIMDSITEEFANLKAVMK